MALTPRQQRFVAEYLVDLNATQAAIRAGYSPKTAQEQSARLLSKVIVSDAIALARDARSERVLISADRVLRDWVDLADADPNELVEHRLDSCRWCHGGGHRYHRTPAERERAWHEHMADPLLAAEPFDELGGVGFDPRRPPHQGCPECHGRGVGVTLVKDTRHLSRGGKLLYAGVRETRDGIEVRMNDRDAARVNVAKHIGMFVATTRHEHTGPDGRPIQHEHSVNVTERIEQLYLAFEVAADRAIAGDHGGDGHGEPVGT